MSARILIIEDDEPSSYLLHYVLVSRGFLCHVALTGEAAIAQTASRLIDYILMDFQLPDMNACELVKRLRGNPRTERVPIALITAEAELPEACRPVLNGNIAEYLDKPVDPLAVLRLLQRFFAGEGAA